MREIPMSPVRMTLLPLAAALLLALAGCSESTPSTVPTGAEAGEDAAAGEADHDESEATALVRMDEAELAAAGIRLQTLQPAVLSESLRAPGEVVENAYGATLITPRVEALVVRRHARLGDEVRAGAPLVTLSSVEVADAQADLSIAEQEWRRVSELGREAVAGRRITEARVALDRARATARAYGLPGTAQGHANGQFTLTAPHAGRITEDDFLVGQRIEPGMPLFRLVDESTVWVDATLPSGIALRIGEDSVATVIADGQRIAGKVLRSAHRTSETTRTASVRIEVPNKGDRLHAGDFVEVRFDAGSAASIDNPALAQLSVPTNALVQLEGDTVVFRRTEDGALAAVPVRKGEVLGDRTVIEEGLEAGDAVVVEGAFAIKSQMLKAQLGEGHGH